MDNFTQIVDKLNYAEALMMDVIKLFKLETESATTDRERLIMENRKDQAVAIISTMLVLNADTQRRIELLKARARDEQIQIT